MFSEPLTAVESLLLSKMDKPGRGFISCYKAAEILNTDIHAAFKVIVSLCEKGYLEMEKEDQIFHLIWR